MRHLLIIVMVFFGAVQGYSQSDEPLMNRAIMLVHADISGFSYKNDGCFIDSILKDYNVAILKSEGVFDCQFFKVAINNCLNCTECYMVIAYYESEKCFYRLQGFKYNEFTEFYNRVLAYGELPNVDGKRKRKIFKQVLAQVSIEGYDLKKSYQRYYNKFKASLFDETSCYRKSIIRAY